MHAVMRRTSVNRGLLLLCFPVFLTGIAWPFQADQSLGPLQEDGFRVQVTVGLVVLDATVRDRKGAIVSGLGEEHFQVFEDEVLQPLHYVKQEDVPATIGLVVDHSRSMRTKRPQVIGAALAFLRLSNPEDEMFVINFNENVAFGLPEDTPFTAEAARMMVALSQMEPEGMTALYDAVAAGLEHLKAGNREKKVLVVISDGADNASKIELAQIMVMARKSNVVIYTVGLFDPDDPDRNPRVLRQLATTTGGEAFVPGSVESLDLIFETIAHDVRNQYTIAYVPTNGARDGTYRNVHVNARRPGDGRLLVRTRAGYHAPLTAQPPTAEASHP